MRESLNEKTMEQHMPQIEMQKIFNKILAIYQNIQHTKYVDQNIYQTYW